MCSNIGLEFCDALPFFYAFSGSDTVSSFFEVGKCKFYDTLSTFKNINKLKEVFKALWNEPDVISQDKFDMLEQFTLHVYYPKQYFQQRTSSFENRFMGMEARWKRYVCTDMAKISICS